MQLKARTALDYDPANVFTVDAVSTPDGDKVINPADGMLIPIQKDSEGRRWFRYPRRDDPSDYLVTFVMEC